MDELPVNFINFVLESGMARILALDIGLKRTGIAVTDPLQLIATGLDGIDTNGLIEYVRKYIKSESVECIVIGKPIQMDNEMSESWNFILLMSKKIGEALPGMKIEFYDERFTSKLAMQSMKMAGAGKSAFKNKKIIDKVSATIILQGYMEFKK